MSASAWWTRNWNVVDGCTKVSPACQSCYAEMMSRRFWRHRFEQGDFEHYGCWVQGGQYGPRSFANVRFHADRLEQPLHWRDPQRVFTTSMGDLFHRDVDDDALMAVFDVMRRTPKHRYLVLTKRPIRAQQFYLEHPLLSLLSNVWLGVTVEDRKRITRLNTLRRIKVAHRWASFEPLLEPLVLESMQLDSLDWAICGGETGPRARPMRAAWAVALWKQCLEAGIPFFFKQAGSAWLPGDGTSEPSDARMLSTREYPTELETSK